MTATDTRDQALQYITDPEGKVISVIVPIEIWSDLAAEKETAFLLSSETMRKRLLEAMNREEGIPWEEVLKSISSKKEKKPMHGFFGIWRDNASTEDVDHYVREIRKGRDHAD